MEKDYLKVVKFGGSSLADAEQFKKVADIIHADSSRKYVVVSAPGKRFKEDFKITDKLYECYETASKGENIENVFGQFKQRYTDIVNGLGLDFDLESEFESIKTAILYHAGRDYAASRGEYLNGKILAAYLGFDFIDAAKCIYFREDGSFDDKRSYDILAAFLRNSEHAVIPGFYGSMPNDTIKTFSRGGSDITGAIVARSAEADLYENWTDVSGFLMADPRVVDNPAIIDTITYAELRELSYMGATVLHEDAIFPVRLMGIPINIRNTNEPGAKGTMIVPAAADNSEKESTVTGIAGKKGFCAITIEKDMMNSEVGFGRKLLEVLEKEKISFEHMPTGIDTLSIILQEKALEENRDAILNNLCEELQPDSLTVEDNIALIAIVGRGMRKTKGTAAKALTAIADADININMIDQGSSELNIIIGVGGDDLEKAIKAIYSAFSA